MAALTQLPPVDGAARSTPPQAAAANHRRARAVSGLRQPGDRCLTASPATTRVPLAWLWRGSAVGVLTAVALQAEERPLPAPVLTDPAAQPFYFALPAPRGQILDREGKSLARSAAVQRLLLRVPSLDSETPEAFIQWVETNWPEILEAFPAAIRPDNAALKAHFEHRRRVPIAISEAEANLASPESPALPPFVEIQTEYLREYPRGKLAAHVVGYVSAAGPPLRGPLLHAEPLWRDITGQFGLEVSMNQQLTGQAGLMVACYDKDSRATQRHILKPPVPGRDIVTTLHGELQAAVEEALASAGRPGAMVVMDPGTGDILAMASTPAFDPSEFASGIGAEAFAKLSGDSRQPLFNRAIAGLYPPGSVFKVVVALAGMRSGRLDPSGTLLCWPEVTIDGRVFRNWSNSDHGWFNLHAAMVRSCNTYFYQAALAVGDQPILETARDLGFGTQLDVSLRGADRGVVPKAVPTAQGQANLAIGQHPILSTPLEVALAMATVANGRQRPRPRLVAQVQDQQGQVLSATEPMADASTGTMAAHMRVIHESMFSVVNHKSGTGGKARVKTMRVHGKTGTAQWSRDGQEGSALWFGGFVKDCEPALAFAVVLEGTESERLSAGNTAAPIAGEFLAKVAAAPARFGIRPGKAGVPYEQHSLGMIRMTNPPQLSVRPEIGRNRLAGVPQAQVAGPQAHPQTQAGMPQARMAVPQPRASFPQARVPVPVPVPQSRGTVIYPGVGEVRRAVPVAESSELLRGRPGAR